MKDSKTRLEKGFQKLKLPAKNIDKFLEFLDILSQWNKSITLTTKKEETVLSHLLLPSLMFFKFFTDIETVVDIGSGAGFPAVILKIYQPELSITMIESNVKKCSFLRYVCSTLNLTCNIINNRIENLSTPLKANCITARAINLKPLMDAIKRKIRADYLFYMTSQDNQLPLVLTEELNFKKHHAKIYKL